MVFVVVILCLTIIKTIITIQALERTCHLLDIACPNVMASEVSDFHGTRVYKNVGLLPSDTTSGNRLEPVLFVGVTLMNLIICTVKR